MPAWRKDRTFAQIVVFLLAFLQNNLKGHQLQNRKNKKQKTLCPNCGVLVGVLVKQPERAPKRKIQEQAPTPKPEKKSTNSKSGEKQNNKKNAPTPKPKKKKSATGALCFGARRHAPPTNRPPKSSLKDPEEERREARSSRRAKWVDDRVPKN